MLLLCIKDMLYRHSAAQEIKHSWKFTSGLIGPQILNFERSLSLSLGPQSSHRGSIHNMEFSMTVPEKGDLLIQVTV
jgi:hypothetical protein